jgi:predicted dehydrogenase
VRVWYQIEFKQRLRVACIGCGGHAYRNLFPAFRYAPIDVIAVCDLRKERARDCARQLGAGGVYSDYRLMLERERPEAVFVVTDYDPEGRPRYPAIAADVLRAGAHAWVEKPIAATSEAVRDLRRVEEETGRFVQVGHKKLFAPAFRKAVELSRRAEFGPVTTIAARYPQRLPAQEDRGDSRKMVGFLDHLVHPVSMLVAIAGPVESIYADRHEGSGGGVTLLRFRSGAVGSLHLAAGQSPSSPLEQLEVIGQGANLVLENGIRLRYHPPGGAAEYGREGDFHESDDRACWTWEPEFSLGQLYNQGLFLLGYAPEVIAFCQAALEGRAPADAGLGHALEVAKVYEAYREGDKKTIALPQG